MTDLLVGTTVQAADFPPSQYDDEATNITGFTSTPFIQGSPVCGVAFEAPTSGRVWVLWGARIEGQTANDRIRVSAHVRTGSTIGSGTTVSTSTDQNAVENPGKGGGSENRANRATFRLVTGLTPGDSYNAVTEHQTAGTGDIYRRTIAVIPLP